MKIDDLYAQLDQLLEAERTALLSADADELQRILRTKEGLMDIVQTIPSDAQQTLYSLLRKAQRNQTLLDSSMQGIRAVAKKVAALQTKKKPLATYDANGRVKALPTSGKQTLEKRA